MYPVWEVPILGSGLILGIIAAVHILPSHLSTSAMWFNVYVETKAYRENRPELLEFIKKYSLLLLVFSYVFGSLTGIGIWYSATVANPRGISGLIHNYVWGWATEWVFFILEVTGIFIYYYTLNKVDKKTHLKIGWIFAISSWTTMVIIVGILAFMLSAGKWPVTGGFFDGFFNQTYWFQLLLRTAFMFVLAGAYALAVGSTIKTDATREFITKSASRWGLIGLALAFVLFFIYKASLPEHSKTVIATVPQGLKTMMIVALVSVLVYFIFASSKPSAVKLPLTVVMIAVIFAGIYSAERGREILRKPYIINEYMYSNQIIGKPITAKGVGSEVEKIDREGILKVSPFVPEALREVAENNMLEAGRVVALLECSSCHVMSEGGVRTLPEMVKRLGLKDVTSTEAFLDGMGGYPYMPPFVGTPAEKKALATYLVSLNK